ncbi:MAG: DUF6508 domain-containing protein [Patescibacteria group bacterium]
MSKQSPLVVALIDLIPEIQAKTTFGNIIIKQSNPDGSFPAPYYEEAPIVQKFRLAAQKSEIIVPFDWRNWEEGRKMLADQDFDFATVDIDTIYKIFTFIIRNDRFCDGFLIKCFESGLILKLLFSLKKYVS